MEVLVDPLDQRRTHAGPSVPLNQGGRCKGPSYLTGGVHLSRIRGASPGGGGASEGETQVDTLA